VRYATGSLSQQDVVRGLLERARIEEAMVGAREQAALAAGRLNALRGLDPAAPVGELAQPPDDPIPPLPALQDLAGAQHPGLQASAREIDVALADEALAAVEERPDYLVEAGYMRMPSETDAWTGRFGISWPRAPWTRGRLDALRREAAARRTAAEAQRRAAANEVARTIHQAHVRAQAAGERSALIRQRLLPRTQHVLELAQLAFQADRGALLDVIEAARSAVDLERELTRADAERWLAGVALERAVGVPLASLGPANQR
jgi:multidrug efflux system outer membrane protein